MRITTKGQVTIPKEIRERAGLLPHTEVEFVLEGDVVRIRKVATPGAYSRGRRAVEALRGRATVGMTTEAIMALTREP